MYTYCTEIVNIIFIQMLLNALMNFTFRCYARKDDLGINRINFTRVQDNAINPDINPAVLMQLLIHISNRQ